MASEIGKLQLPSLVIPGLFLPTKIVIQQPRRSSSLCSQKVAPINASSTNTNEELGPPPGIAHPDINEGDLELPRASSESPPPPPYPSQASHSEAIKENEKSGLNRPRRVSVSSTATKSSGTSSPSPERQQQRGGGNNGGPVSYRTAVQTQQHMSPIPSSLPDTTRAPRSNTVNNSGKSVKQRRINQNIVCFFHLTVR